MDLILGRDAPGTPSWSDSAAERAVRSLCSGSEAGLASRVPASLPPFSADRFVPLGELGLYCSRSLSSRSRPFAEVRQGLTEAWARVADAVVVISLRGETRKRRHVMQELTAVGLSPELDGRSFWYIADRPRLRDGKFGCYRSHMAVAAEAMRRGWRRWVVFEDDAFILPQLTAGMLHNVADTLAIDPEVLVVGMGSNGIICDEGGEHEARSVFPVRSFGVGSTCYLATLRFADRARPLMELMGREDEPEEALLHPDYIEFDKFLYSHGLPGVYHVLPNPVAAQDLGSNIGYPWYSPLRLSAWAVRTFRLDGLVRGIADPRARKAALVGMSFGLLVALALVVVVPLVLTGRRIVRRRRARAAGRGGPSPAYPPYSRSASR